MAAPNSLATLDSNLIFFLGKIIFSLKISKDGLANSITPMALKEIKLELI